MKKVILILSLCVLSFSVLAQEKNEVEKLSVAQRNELQLKKMTLDLDLSTSQQNQISAIIASNSAKREAMKANLKARKENHQKLTADERFELKNKMLDEQIVLKNKMKDILSKQQFEKWEANHKENIKKIHKIKARKHHNEVSR